MEASIALYGFQGSGYTANRPSNGGQEAPQAALTARSQRPKRRANASDSGPFGGGGLVMQDASRGRVVGHADGPSKPEETACMTSFNVRP